MLAVITAVQAKLIEGFGLVETTAPFITAPDLFQIFLPTLQAHKSIFLGNIDYESTTGLATGQPLCPGNIYLESIRAQKASSILMDIFQDSDRLRQK
jgi:hypothetical protein